MPCSITPAGFSYDMGKDEQSIRCAAAPERDRNNRIIAAISVSSTVEHMDVDRMQALVPVVQQSARQISVELGGNNA